MALVVESGGGGGGGGGDPFSNLDMCCTKWYDFKLF